MNTAFTASHVTSLQLLPHEEAKLKYLFLQCRSIQICTSRYELYRMILPTESDFLAPLAAAALLPAPLAAAALLPTEGNKIMMTGLSNVLLDRTHPRMCLTRNVQVPLKHIRELQPCVQLAWPVASLAGSGRQAWRAATCGGQRGWESVWWGQGELKITWDEILGSKERK